MIYQLALFVVLLPLIHAVSDDGKMTPEKLVRDLNEIRREVANNYSIPNMHQLVWSESLVEIGKQVNLDDKTTWNGNRVTPIAFYIPDSYKEYTKDVLRDEVETISLWTSEKRNVFFKPRLDLYIPILEVFNPPQKHIGCIFILPGEVFFYLCVLGDSGKFELWDFEKKSTSVPGSKCTPGYVNDDGLCVVAPPTTTTTTTTVPPAPKQPPTPQRPAPVPTPAKQTSEKEKHPDSEGSEDEEISHSSRVSLALATVFYISWALVV